MGRRALGLVMRAALLAAASALPACSPAVPPASHTAEPVEASILERSSPGAGATVRGPVEQIELWFDPPARLGELTVTGADGLTMPTMVTAIGETRYYSVPVGLSKGTYSVTWRATVGGATHRGSFSFTVI